MTLPHTSQLLNIMAKLRNPDGGCPWDLEQNFATIAPYTIEEAYEVADAIAKGDMKSLRDELGDLLLQVVFHAQMAQEAGDFDFEAVAESICTKMVARHPHVFGDAEIQTAQAQTDNWEKLKEQERRTKQKEGVLADVPLALPALMRAEKLQKRAARVGFDWPDIRFVYDKIEEELNEVKEAAGTDKVAEEIGDVLFVLANLARHHKVDPEEALRQTNAKFERRFAYIEAQLSLRGRTCEESTLEEMDALWSEAKRQERV